MRRALIPAAALAILALTAAPTAAAPPGPTGQPDRGAAAAAPVRPAAVLAAGVPRPDHVVVVIEENHAYSSIIGNSQAPYLNSLANQGALFTQSFGVTHPSEPNYLALFSGSTHGLTSDSCPHTYSTDNLGAELIGAGLSFTGYSESMPSDGYTGCTSGSYARKHNPWVNFTNVPAADNRTLAAFPTSYASLPTVSIVVPNLVDDMHDGSIATGDAWLQSHLDGYAQWALTHNSLLVVTFDEDDSLSSNHIATIFFGQQVRTGQYSEHITHYNVLRTLEDAYGLPYAGSAATATPITDAWTATGGAVTVTNPGAQARTVNVATSLQMQAGDTAGGTLSWSASGLPSGLGINAGTGLISGTPATTGSFTSTVTATDSTGPSGSATFTWTISGTTGCTAAQLLGNPGFETGTASPWTSSPGVVSNSTTEPPHSGSWDAWLDGYGTTHTDTLGQSVTIPSGCTAATLTFWLHIDTAETTTTTAYDTLTIKIGNTTVASYSNLNHATGYTQRTVNLSGFLGASGTLTFTGTEDSSLQTSFVIDDAALTVS